MKYYYNNKTRKRISEDEYKALSPEEQKNCREWKERKPSGRKQDPEWYIIDPAITKSVASIPFNVFSGVNQTISWYTGSGGTLGKDKTVVPGIMVFNVIPTYGASKSGSSAINIASKALYTYVRHMNSGKSNYESPDLMMYVMAMSQIYAAINEAERAYELAMTYTYENKTIPNALSKALKVNLTDIQNNLADFRAGINLRIAKASSLVIPEGFHIHKRHALIFRTVFTDSASLRSQFYAFAPRSFLKWNAKSSTAGTSLSEEMVSSGRTVAQIFQVLDELLNAIVYDEDANIMSGDILKAFGRDRLYELNFLDENSTLDIVFNENVLSQIENARWPEFNSKSSYSIQQSDTDIYTYEPEFAASAGNNLVLTDSAFFNSHKDDPTPEDVIEWSRLCMGFNSGTVTYGTELITSVDMYTAQPTTPGSNVGYTMKSIPSNMSIVNAGTASNVYSKLQIQSIMSKFDWHPIIYYIRNDTSEETVTQYLDSYFGDLKVVALLDTDKIAQLNDAAIMGALNSLKYINAAKANEK